VIEPADPLGSKPNVALPSSRYGKTPVTTAEPAQTRTFC